MRVEHPLKSVVDLLGMLPCDMKPDCGPDLFSFSFLAKALGTPSHLELTLGTFAGSFAEETIGIPAGFIGPRCEACCCFRISAW